jgi:hypothetical protein
VASSCFASRLIELSLHGCRQVTSSDVLCELCTVLQRIKSLSLGHMPCVTDKVIDVLATVQHDGSGRLRKLRLDHCRNLTANCLRHVSTIAKLHQVRKRLLYSCFA